MTVNITILGLGRVGGSLARCLAPRAELRVSGYDQDASVARQAQSQGVLRKAHWNLLNAVGQADLVLMAAPMVEQRETLKVIAPELRQGCVVATVGPLLAPPLAWAGEWLAGPPERHFVACHAALNPAGLYSDDTGFEASSADLFKQGLWALAPAPRCAPEGLRLVADLVRLLQAFPYFVDPAEHDGLAGASEMLPALLALALMQAADSPGWSETRKVADRSFATATAALVDVDLAALRANRENTLRYLDAALAALQSLRQQMAANAAPGLDDAFASGFADDFASAIARRSAWLAERRRGDWEHPADPLAPLPTTGDMLGRLLVGGLFAKHGERDEGQ
jgi:prephenate dehydrogenase